MHAKKACDHNDHDYYADDVKNIHALHPLKEPKVFRAWKRARSPITSTAAKISTAATKQQH
jgi:hypothetical protein